MNYQDFQQQLGDLLKRARESRGITPLTVYQKTNLSYLQLENIEKGGTKFSSVTLRQAFLLAELYEVDILSLIPSTIFSTSKIKS